MMGIGLRFKKVRAGHVYYYSKLLIVLSINRKRERHTYNQDGVGRCRSASAATSLV